MKRPERIVIAAAVMLVALSGVAPGIDWKKRLADSEEELAAAKTEKERFECLDSAAQAAFEASDMEKALRYARESLALAEKYRQSWNYGNAIHHGHLLLGHAALRNGDVATARKELLAAGATPGSPQLDSFGPNMALARAMLDRGERAVVLQYLEACGKFWKMGQAQLDHWKEEIEAGHVPDFGANLVY